MQGRDAESAAFKLVTRDLDTATNGAERIRALGRNHQLWSILVKDMSLQENRLPGALKEELTKLGLWSMHYSTLAVLRDLPVEPLISVNRNVLAGLLAQQEEIAPTPASRILPTDAI